MTIMKPTDPVPAGFTRFDGSGLGRVAAGAKIPYDTVSVCWGMNKGWLKFESVGVVVRDEDADRMREAIAWAQVRAAKRRERREREERERKEQEAALWQSRSLNEILAAFWKTRKKSPERRAFRAMLTAEQNAALDERLRGIA
jgi:hypothetical protein